MQIQNCLGIRECEITRAEVRNLATTREITLYSAPVKWIKAVRSVFVLTGFAMTNYPLNAKMKKIAA
jgi:hypothetical protein